MDSDPFGISFEKSSFQTGDGLERIRWGVFKGSDGESRFAAFRVTMLDAHFAGQTVEDFVVESDNVVNSEGALTGPKFQAYEWNNDHFERVDPEEQSWFKFK